MEVPPTQYAKLGNVHVAWSAGGHGPPDILYCSNWTSHLDAFWDWAPHARFVRRLATLGRVILFDLPGNGLSDPVSLSQLPTAEEWMDYVRLVMDAAGSERAVVFAAQHAGCLAIPFAATHPDRVAALILWGAFARVLQADEYEFGTPTDMRNRGIQWWLQRWGTGRQLELTAPEVADDPYETALMGRAERYSASPGVAAAFFAMMADSDVRNVLPAVNVPTLVLQRERDRWTNVQHGRYLAAHIPGAQYVELPGDSGWVCYGDMEGAVREIRQFLVGLPEPRDIDRVLATILFTDIVDSTKQAAKLGDGRWRELLERHDNVVRETISRFRGRDIKATGDGFLASFDGAARAVRCALGIRDAVRPLGLQVRSGLHSGEIELRQGDVAGIAVHAASRVSGLAAAGEVLVSQMVKDLTVGSGLLFDEQGEHELKGVPGSWKLFAVRA